MNLGLTGLINSYNQHSQLKKNVISGSLYTGGNTIVTLLAYPIYLKYLGAEQYGLWAIISVVFSFSQFGQLGTDIALSKFVASEYATKNSRAITEYITTSFYVLLVPSIIIISLISFFKVEIAHFIKVSESFKDEGVKLIFYVGVVSLYSFILNALRGVVVGIGRLDIANYGFLISRVLQIILAIFLLSAGFGLWSLFYSLLLYHLLPTVIWIVMLTGKYQIKIFDQSAFNKEKMGEFIKYGGSLVTGALANMFVIPFNKVIIGRYIGLSEVAYYQIAVQGVLALRNILVKGLESLIPKISELQVKCGGLLSSVFAVHKKGMKVVYFFAFPLFILTFIFAESILKLWLASEFNIQMVFVMRILLIGWLINSMSVPDYYMFIGLGKPGLSVTATCIKSITNVILIFCLLAWPADLSLNKVVLIDAISLSMAVVFLKYKCIQFSKLMRVSQT